MIAERVYHGKLIEPSDCGGLRTMGCLLGNSAMLGIIILSKITILYSLRSIKRQLGIHMFEKIVIVLGFNAVLRQPGCLVQTYNTCSMA